MKPILRMPRTLFFLRGGLPRRLLLLLSCSALWAGLWQTCPAQSPKPKKAAAETAKTIPGGTAQMTAADIEAFLDGLMPLQLERDDIAGAVVAVVKDGQVLFAKGYGYANVAENKLVTPDSTLFRPGSVSKLFTWTAVMQLVEQGKLNLDRDVNEYLDFRIPDTYPQPITLRHIMTHTAGFEEAVKHLFVPETKNLQPLRTYLIDHMPKRIFPPGKVPAYSNYATALAGYIVERTSGQPFDDYIHDHIFQPLGMSRTTFVQPLPDDLKPLMSAGYMRGSDAAKPFEVVQAWPAGSVSTCAADMARFMIAHLQNGQFHDARILRTETAQLMHTRQSGPHPLLNGMALGFYEETRNGHRIIGHAGDTVYFHTDLHLMPEDGIGFFVSYNSAGKGEISDRTALWDKFLDRYFPYQVPEDRALSTAAQDARDVAGYYQVSRRSEGNILQVLSLLGQLKVTANPDGTISSDAMKDFNGKPKKFSEVQPLLFRDVKGQDRLGFQRDANGNLDVASDFPVFIFQRVKLWQQQKLNYIVFGASAAVLLLALFFWPISALVRRHYGAELVMSRGERTLRTATRLVCALDVGFIAGVAVLAGGLSDPNVLFNLDKRMHIVQAIGLLGAVGTIVALFNAVAAWSSRSIPVHARAAGATLGISAAATASVLASRGQYYSRWWWSKVFETLVALACIGFTAFVAYWNLLNFSIRY